MPLRRPSSTGDGLSPKRLFPLLGRRKTRHSDVSSSSPVALPSSPASTSPAQKIAKSGLRVHVQVKFENPHGSEHARDYEASPKLKVTDRICQALLSRLQHCSSELITRHDSNALDPLRKPHRDVKPLRYRITYRVERDGAILVEKSLRSFQEYELTHDDIREVVAATDRIVGLFLVRHDPGFQWTEFAEPEAVNPESETFRPCTGRPQSMACIPRSHFVHESQSFEFVAGYSIELFLRSRCATRYPENRNASIKIDSRQPSPLPLLLGEELTTRVSNLIVDPVDAWKRKFGKRHRTCTGLEGSGGCSHIEDGAVDVMVKVRNHLGPDYTYFSHRVQTSKVLFNDHNGRDFDEFANQVKAKLEKARDMTDKSLRSLDDLTLQIHELRGKNWSVHEPLVVRLDPTVTYCRQTIEAVMERLQTGISNVLEHHENSLATMTVHKRGHLIFDGFLDGAGGDDTVHYEKFASADLERKALEAHLKERIRSDITMLCRDTCAIDCPDTLSNLRLKASGTAASSAGALSSIRPPPSTGGASPLVPTPSLVASSIPRQASDASFSGSFGSTRSSHSLAKKAAQQSLKDSFEPLSPVTSSPDLHRVPSGVGMAKKHGYMSDLMADDENQSESPSTPSLVDTDSISPRDSILATPPRATPQDQSNDGLRIIDDGRRIIYHEQSDMDAIASGVVEFHRPITDDEKPHENPDLRAAHRSLDPHMPVLSGKVNHHEWKQDDETDSQGEPKAESPVTPEPEKADEAKEALPIENIVGKPPKEGPFIPKEPKVDANIEQVVQTLPVTESLKPSVANQPEIHQTFQQDQWEKATHEHSTEVEASTKSETSFSTTPAASIRDDNETRGIAAHDQPSELQEKQTESPSEPEVETAKVTPVDAEKFPTYSDSGISMDEEVKDEEPQTKIVAQHGEDASTHLLSEEITKTSVSSERFEKAGEQNTVANHEVVATEPASEKTDTFLDTVPEDNLLEPAVTVAEDSQVISTELPKPQEELTPLDKRPYLPTIASDFRERMPSREDFFPLPPVPEKEKEQDDADKPFDTSDFSTSLTRPRARPRTNTLPSRPYSTALTLEINVNSYDPDQEYSPVEDAPNSANSANSAWSREAFHRRQASAGFVGLSEQRRLHSGGFRSALMPYRWQQMRHEQAIWEGRPGTSHSEH
ncbi:hypothetical protein F66182_2627 [Fusarium sp. NRRL 66182]|nr:hypothetical protein F66182_2627 [Fusarium sp. NRRL 66182]